MNRRNSGLGVAIRDLPMHVYVDDMQTEAELLMAAVLELRERLDAGRLDTDSRDEIASVMLAAASRLRQFGRVAVGGDW